MNLFGGSENYVLQSFQVRADANEPNPHIFLEINKVHNPKDVLVGTSVQVQDEYKVNEENVVLFISEVGRFIIEPIPFLKAKFDLFKKIVTTEKNFILTLEIGIETWKDSGSKHWFSMNFNEPINSDLFSFT